MNKQKIIIKGAIGITIIAIVMALLIFLINSVTPKTYSSAKKECENILEKHQVQMEDIAVDSLKSKTDVSGHYLEYYYSRYQKENNVKFDIDGQGMLGGQYWALVYTQDGNLWGENERYLYEEIDGNNIVKAEKLNDHWWFFWTDYDGTDRSYK